LLGIGYTSSTKYWYGFNGGTPTPYYTYTSSSTDSPTGNLYLGLGATWGTDLPGNTNGVSTSITLSYTWVRARAYPPNGVMPSVSFSSVIPTASLYLNDIKDANTTITYGTESNFTATIASGNYVRLWINNTPVTPYTLTSVSYLKTLAAGVYRVTAQANTSGVSNVTY
ncbi:MAG: hypothetical protein ACP5MV_04695, partial [Candidatus Parvarchaeum sp.]